MSTDRIIEQIVAANVGAPRISYEATRAHVETVMRAAFSSSLRSVEVAGSVAKGTNIAGDSDLDLFVSLSRGSGVLADVYADVRNVAHRMGWSPIEQNVSIGAWISGYKIDLVPGRVQDGYRVWHSLYRRKARSWVQTNVVEQIRYVRRSGRASHIRAMKLWRRRYGVSIPSFALELAVISACRGLRGGIANDLLSCLHSLSSGFERMRLEDPANTNNNLQDDLTIAERRAVATAAQRALAARTWTEMLVGP